jgi:hypothetical protein
MTKLLTNITAKLFLILFLTSLLLFLSFSGKGFQNNIESIYASALINVQDTTITYPVSVKFLSVCCGVPSDSPLKKCIRAFKQKYKIKKIKAMRIGPLGREGEYDLAFELTGMSISRKRDFINRMKKAAIQMKDKGKAIVELDVTYDPSTLPGRLSMEKVEF